MAEIIALIIALLCLAGSSPAAAAFFISLGVAAAAWRAYQAREASKRAQTEIDSLRAEVRHTAVLAERALRIAAETANSMIAPAPASPSRPATTVPKPEPVAETPQVASPIEKVSEEEKPLPAPTIDSEAGRNAAGRSRLGCKYSNRSADRTQDRGAARSEASCETS